MLVTNEGCKWRGCQQAQVLYTPKPPHSKVDKVQIWNHWKIIEWQAALVALTRQLWLWRFRMCVWPFQGCLQTRHRASDAPITCDCVWMKRVCVWNQKKPRIESDEASDKKTKSLKRVFKRRKRLASSFASTAVVCWTISAYHEDFFLLLMH